jgi:NAD-dependent DNA ligase
MTGFSNSRKAELASIAIESGFRVVTGVTKNLEFLCVGEEPGPNKVKKAKEQNVPIITEQQFLKIVETGELPDEC